MGRPVEFVATWIGMARPARRAASSAAFSTAF